MAWETNDPWARSVIGAKTDNKPRAWRQSSSVVDASLIDPKAVQAATLLMSISARECSNRQCSAANTSALFHLLMGSGAQETLYKAMQVSPSAVAPSIATAQRAQSLLSEHSSVNYGTLAKALQSFRKLLPQHLARKLDEVNKAASYDRHHVVVDEEMIDDLKRALEELEPADVGSDFVEGISMQDIDEKVAHGNEVQKKEAERTAKGDKAKEEKHEEAERTPLEAQIEIEKVVENEEDQTVTSPTLAILKQMMAEADAWRSQQATNNVELLAICRARSDAG
jgi:hypothetical protein